MSSSDPADESAAAAADSKFLESITFVTGEDANVGSFLLVVGSVTCVFIALFQFTLPEPISHLLTAGVLFVTVLSAIFAALLDSLGYFEQAAGDAAVATTGRADRSARPWVPTDRKAAPLPPMINFDDELRTYAEMYDGDLPEQFDPFIRDYLRLKTNTGNRRTIASDLRADLNPIGALFEEGTEGDDLYEAISDGLFRYIDSDTEHVTLDRIVFYDGEGNEVDVSEIRDRLGRVELTVSNEGEAVDVDVLVQFYDAGGASISSRTCKVGTAWPGTTRTVDTDVFVPSETSRVGTTIRVSNPKPGLADA
ncbi:hypothetical protein [Halosimplex litoreum]|uniref:hypothetical protein n=1 Tax=Halosimplex litoreum TaxID=1198301 RepID=UPI001E58B42C|nr:hypothetical protein [Halosimplex litoreum]